MTAPPARPQDHLRLRDDAVAGGPAVVQPHSTALWTVLSLPLLGYFVWYFRATRDCARLLDDGSEPWFWMAMLLPGMVLVIPYAIAQARIVARVELASRASLSTGAYLAVCVGGFVIPALMPLVLQPRLNRVAWIDPEHLRAMPIG